MKKFLIPVLALAFVTSAFAGDGCCKSKAAKEGCPAKSKEECQKNCGDKCPAPEKKN